LQNFPLKKKNKASEKYKISDGTARITFLLKIANQQIKDFPASKTATDSAGSELRVAAKINEQVKSDQYAGLIALARARFYDIRLDYDGTLYYSKSAISSLKKINAYAELGNAYQIYAMHLPFDTYSSKIDAIKKAGFYYQKAGNQEAKSYTKHLMKFFAVTEKNYVVANRKAKVLRSEIIPDKINKAQVLLLLKIAEYQIKKPLEETADLDSAKYLIEAAKKINDKLKDPECETAINVSWADLYSDGGNVTAEKLAVDKGINTLSNAKSDNNFIGDLDQLTQMATTGDMHSFHIINSKASDAVHYYKQSGQIKKMADVLVVLGKFSFKERKVDLAGSQFKQALMLYKSIHYPYLADIYLQLSKVADFKGDLDQAISLNLECQKYITDSTSIELKIESETFLVYIYYHADMLPQAVFWAEKLSEESKLADNSYDYYYAVQTLTLILIQTHHPAEALKRLQQAVIYYPPPNISLERFADEAFGECLSSLHQYARAEPYMLRLEKSLEGYFDVFGTGNEYSYYSKLAGHLYYLAHFYASIGNPVKARGFLQKMNVAAANAEKILPQSLNSMEQMEFQVDTALKDYQSALIHFEHFNKVKDSLLSASKTRAIEELNIRYATEARLKDIKLLENRSELQKNQLRQVTVQKNIVIAGIVVIFLVSLIIYTSYRSKQRVNKELELKQARINEQNAALEGLVSQKDDLLQDKERLLVDKELLMMEIQHRVKNNLHMISSLLESQSAYLEDEALLAIQKGQHRIQAISLVHQKLYANTDVMEVAMDVYLRELITYLRESVVTDQNIVFDVDLDPISLSGGQAMPLGLIVNEAVTNAIKYAFGDRHLGHIGISLKGEPGNYISLSIFDDGVGLPPDHEENTKASSMGMKLIKGLAKTIGGEVTIQSAPGTTIDLRFKKIELFKAATDQNEYSSLYTGVS